MGLFSHPWLPGEQSWTTSKYIRDLHVCRYNKIELFSHNKLVIIENTSVFR